MNKKYYQLVTANRILLGEKMTEYRHFKLVSIDYKEISPLQISLNFELIDQKMESHAMIHDWTKEIDAFQNKLSLAYNLEEEQLSIENYKNLRRKWQIVTRSHLLKKFKQKGAQEMVSSTELFLSNRAEFEKQFIGYGVFRVFFNPYFQMKEEKHPFSILNYFGPELDLDLTISSEKKDPYTLQNTAQLDLEKFDQRSLTLMLREITHSFDIKVDVQVELEENFVFNENNTPKQVDLFLDIDIIENVYHTTTAHQLTEISLDELKNISKEWELNGKKRSPII